MPHYMGEYSQDHCRITEQSEVVGHAVRAALMYTGLTALGMVAGASTEAGASMEAFASMDSGVEGTNEYLKAAKRLWDNMEQTKQWGNRSGT